MVRAQTEPLKFTPAQVADAYGVERDEVLRWIKGRRISHHRVTEYGPYHIDEDQLREAAWLRDIQPSKTEVEPAAQQPRKRQKAVLYRHYDVDGTLLYVGVSISIMVRISGHANHSHWFDDIAWIDIERFESREQAIEAERQAIKREKPIHNIRHNGHESSNK